MSAAVHPDDIATLRRWLATEAEKSAHQERYPEWWAVPAEQSCNDGSPEAACWAEICGRSVDHEMLRHAVARLVGVADQRCLIHEDCLDQGGLAVACARTAESNSPIRNEEK